MKSRLPELLKQYRRKHGISQQRLAEKLNTVQSYISKIERGWRPSKSSDLDFLRQVSDELDINPEELGLLRNSGNAVHQRHIPSEAFEAWSGIIDLAEIVRSRGNPEAAVKHVAPIVSMLNGGGKGTLGDLGMTNLAIRAKLTLGTALGDCVPSSGLVVALDHLREANKCADDSDRELKVQVLRAYGNELRKSGDVDSALLFLRQAKALLPFGAVNGSLAIAIARAEAEIGNWKAFRSSMADARRALDIQHHPLPLFNGLVVHEVLLRGLLAQEDFRGVENQLATSVEAPLNSAPQWRVIYAVTIAEALFNIRDVTGGVQAARRALNAARQAALPQQIKRLLNVLIRFRNMSDELEILLLEAKLALAAFRRAGP